MTTPAKDCASREPLCTPLLSIFVRSEVGLHDRQGQQFLHITRLKTVGLMTLTGFGRIDG